LVSLCSELTADLQHRKKICKHITGISWTSVSLLLIDFGHMLRVASRSKHITAKINTREDRQAMLRKLYDWVIRLSEHRHAPAALFGVAVAESSFFPLPPDLMLVPMVLADRLKAWRYAILTTIGSVIGGLIGYYIGAVLFETVGKPIVEFYGLTEKLDVFFENYKLYGAVIVFVAGFTPVPYKVFTIASGVAGLSLPVFLLASLVSRGARFFIVAGLLYFFGVPIRAFIEKYLGLLTVLFTLILVGGFVAIKYLF
jgi:membrane protein YqaA with SNARE-associated domain